MLLRLVKLPIVVMFLGLGIHSIRAESNVDTLAVGPQYDTTHVYVAPDKTQRFVKSFIQTFGGKSTKQVVATVTPTPSTTTSQLVLTPSGSVSVFGFKSPIPYPFGLERTGYLVTDIDKAVDAARQAGATVVVKTFPDPIGRDAVIQWPGGVNMQLYWHKTPPAYPELSACAGEQDLSPRRGCIGIHTGLVDVFSRQDRLG